jgi:hypothetical protein
MPSRDPMAAFRFQPGPVRRNINPSRSVSPDINRNESQHRPFAWPRTPKKVQTPSPLPASDYMRAVAPHDAAELKMWEADKKIREATKQRDEARSTGSMPPPPPRKLAIAASIKPPSEADKALSRPAMRRQHERWERKHEARMRRWEQKSARGQGDRLGTCRPRVISLEVAQLRARQSRGGTQGASGR